MSTVLMLHDADCGFCTRMAALTPRLGLTVEDRSIQETDLAAYGIDPERAMLQMPAVEPDGTVTYGHRAWSSILRAGPWPWRVVGTILIAPGIDPISARVYRWISENRERLPGGTPACTLDSAPRKEVTTP